MKLALISDIHANLEAFNAVIADARAREVDAFACLGDIVGYAADPSACLELLRSLEPVAIIQGNHDAYCADDRDLSGFNPLAREATRWTRQQLSEGQRRWLASLPLEARLEPDLCLVHATPSEPETWNYIRFYGEGALAIEEQTARICCYGHTHVPMAFRQADDEVLQLEEATYDLATGDRWLINVGSVGQPRDGDWRAAWSLLDTEAQRLTLHRVDYEIETCMTKILDAGLPPRLAERLTEGR